MIGKIVLVVADCSVTEFREILQEVKVGNCDTVAEKIANSDKKEVSVVKKAKKRKCKLDKKYKKIKAMIDSENITIRSAVKQVIGRTINANDYRRLKEM